MIRSTSERITRPHTWATVERMIERVVVEAAAASSEQWLEGLRRIGIDEVYRKGRRYLLCVVCHGTARIVGGARP